MSPQAIHLVGVSARRQILLLLGTKRREATGAVHMQEVTATSQATAVPLYEVMGLSNELTGGALFFTGTYPLI